MRRPLMRGRCALCGAEAALFHPAGCPAGVMHPRPHYGADGRWCAGQYVPAVEARVITAGERDAAERERQAAWARAHPPAPEVVNARYRARRGGIAAAGREINAAAVAAAGAWDPTEPVDWLWRLSVTVPFSYGMSKNKMLFIGQDGRPPALRVEYRGMRDDLRDAIAVAVAQQSITVVQAKLWLDVLVEKPDNRGDAVNVVDLVCDAVKVAIGLDDRWFAIRRLDWRIAKDAPRLLVALAQETDRDQMACSSCGRVLELDDFAKGRGPLGVGRNCRECRRIGERRDRLAAKNGR